jgi:NTP pyrophosphatase (non-canonical NTP hydrolase)
MPYVLAFAEVMESKLDENRHKGRTGWRHMTPSWLLERLQVETRELERAMKTKNSRDIAREAADVANFAMFIADKFGGLTVSKESK